MALVDQMMRASRLEVPFYEEVERDESQTNNALTVVVITALAAGVSGAIGAAVAGTGVGSIVLGLVGGIVAAGVGWALWCGIVYFVGTSIFKGTATWGEVLRTVGFAQSPNVLRILGFIPIVGGLISFIAGIWALVASVIAV